MLIDPTTLSNTDLSLVVGDFDRSP